jgi:hypothetical protein
MISTDLDNLLKLAFLEGFNTHKAIINSHKTDASWEDIGEAIKEFKKEYKTTVDDILKPTQEKILELYDEVIQHYKEQNITIIKSPFEIPDRTFRFYNVIVHHAIGEINFIDVFSPDRNSARKKFNEIYPEGDYSYCEEKH